MNTLGQMKLSRLYSNKANYFPPIDFRPGINVVLAKITLPQNKQKDTHNLGKTTLGKILNFALLSKKDQSLFLFKNFDKFEDFVFFLEIELDNGRYVTIRRSVKEASKIAFKYHKIGRQDFSNLELQDWDQPNIPFLQANKLLDGLLDWRVLNPWSFRKLLGYLLRTQDDYRNVFQLHKFISKHSDWKPFLAHLLGFNARLINEFYNKEKELVEKKNLSSILENELGNSIDKLTKIENDLQIKEKEYEKNQKLLDNFDFRFQDREKTKKLVNRINTQIALFNERRYKLCLSKEIIQNSLKDEKTLFNIEETEQLFKEAGILFKEHLKKDFEQLVTFNKTITEERRCYLQQDLLDINSELEEIDKKLLYLGKKRSKTLSFLSEKDIFCKYKRISNELVILKTEINSLSEKYDRLRRLSEIRGEIQTLLKQKANLQELIEADVKKQSSDEQSQFSHIRIFFDDIIKKVINRRAILSVSVNREGHLDFDAEILDESGKTTSASLGHTYQKLLCIAFDLAVLRAHLDENFPRFVFHDGIFESLDDRKKNNLITVIRNYADLGIQPIVTLIDSDLPQQSKGESPVFLPEDVIKFLHDDGAEGRLFNMPAW